MRMEWREVISFWFEECTPEQWFRRDDTLDRAIRERFYKTYQDITEEKTANWRATPQGRLAEVIVLDQFSRNMFRGTPKAFAEDARALRLAGQAISVGDDKKLPRAMRPFLYMPYMHSESKEAHRKALFLFLRLIPWGFGYFRYELKHKRIIDRFGRYPHRNRILGRQSTPAEEEFMKHHPGF